MKGILSNSKWFITDFGSCSYMAQRTIKGETETEYFRAHCLACAKTEILMKKGGQVDTRGWHLQGNCGSFLYVSAKVAEDEENQEN